MAALPPRRPTGAFGGQEERTPLPLTANERIMVIEAHMDRAFMAIEELAGKTNQLADTTKIHGEMLHGTPQDIEAGIAWKINDVYKTSKRWSAVAWAVVTAAAIAISAAVVQLYGSRMSK